MPVQVYIPTPYRQFTGGQSQVAAEATTIAALIEELASRFPGLADRIRTAEGEIPGHLNVYVNRTEVRSLQGPETALADGDEVALIPAMAGGENAGQGNGGAAPATAGPLLREDQLTRYSRHIRLPEVGLEGQRKLLDAKVLVIGAGGLGSPAAIYLAAAGVGTIGIVDADVVDLSNLQRQILHFDRDIGRPKTQSARRHLEDLNPDVQVVEHRTFLTSENALDIIRGYDLVINGSDNFPTRYLVNDACVLLRKPLVDASILRFEGQLSVFIPGRGCYRCLFPSPPPPGMVPSCAQAGIIGALAGHMGTLQVIEAVKVLLGIGEPLASRLVLYDALAGDYQVLRWERNPKCPVCGDEPTITELIDYEAFCGVPAAPEADLAGLGASAPPGSRSAAPAAAQAPPAAPHPPQARPAASSGPGWDLAPGEVRRRLEAGDVQLFDVREPWEWELLGSIAGATPLPMNEVQRRLDAIDPAKDAIFYCNVGERSGTVVKALRRAGFERTYNLKGGIFGWMNERLPVVTGAGQGDAASGRDAGSGRDAAPGRDAASGRGAASGR